MDRYRRLGMEYRFHDDAGEPASLSLRKKTAEIPGDAGDEAGAVADAEGAEKTGDSDAA